MGDVNLFPPARIVRKQRKSKIRLWTVICGMYLLSLTALGLSAHAFWRDTDESVIEDIAFTAQRIEGYNAMISELQEKLIIIQAELEAKKIIEYQPDWTKLLVLVGHELQEEIVLKECQLVAAGKSSGNTKNGAQNVICSSPDVFLAERQYTLELNGFGRTQTSASQFVLRLEQMEMFDTVELVNSRRQNFMDGEAVVFKIECRI